MYYYGHIKEDPKTGEALQKEYWQLLRDHLTRVGDLAGERASKFGAEKLGRIAELAHDIGKYWEAFQQWIETDGQGTGKSSTSRAPCGHDLLFCILNCRREYCQRAWQPYSFFKNYYCRLQNNIIFLINQLAFCSRGLQQPVCSFHQLKGFTRFHIWLHRLCNKREKRGLIPVEINEKQQVRF